MQMNQFETMYRIFLTAFHIAKTNRPLSDFKELISLQLENSFDMGRILHASQ